MGETDVETLLAGLRRTPDIEAPNLYAVDASDRLILDLARERLAGPGPVLGAVATVGDHHGAVTLGAITLVGGRDRGVVRSYQDPITGERALARNAARVEENRFRHCGLDADTFAGVRTVLMQLPRSLAELDEIAEAIARWADPEVHVIAAGRVKHMSRSMNEVLGRHFATVDVTHARSKSRALIATGPRPADRRSYPVRAQVSGLGFAVFAHGGAFGGAGLDPGTRLLLEHTSAMMPTASTIVDLGCGTGILATQLARRRPAATVIATDRTRSAVASTAATASAAGVRVLTRRDDAMVGEPDDSVDLVVCNPPFHENNAVRTGGAKKMFAAAHRVLRAGGQLWTVYNHHLHYRPMLTSVVGPTDVVARSAKFTLTRSVRPPR